MGRANRIAAGLPKGKGRKKGGKKAGGKKAKDEAKAKALQDFSSRSSPEVKRLTRQIR